MNIFCVEWNSFRTIYTITVARNLFPFFLVIIIFVPFRLSISKFIFKSAIIRTIKGEKKFSLQINVCLQSPGRKKWSLQRISGERKGGGSRGFQWFFAKPRPSYPVIKWGKKYESWGGKKNWKTKIRMERWTIRWRGGRGVTAINSVGRIKYNRFPPRNLRSRLIRPKNLPLGNG